MRNLWLVTEFTIKEMIKRKSFIISTLVLLIIIATAFNIPNIMKMLGKNDFNEEILVIDPENLFEGNVEVLNQMNMGYNFEITTENLNYDQLKQKIENDKDECIKFTKNEETIKMEYIVESAAMNFGTVPQELVSIFTNLYSKIQISKLNITPEELATIEPEFDVVLVETDENAAKGNVTIMMIISLVLFYAVFFCAQQVSVAITTEKTSKIIETLVTSTDSKTIVLGKTLGIGIVGLVQVILMITVAVISAKFCIDPELLNTIFDVSSITPKLLILTLVYFCFGYALYSLFFALTGATVSKPEDVQYANGPVSFVAVIGFYLAYFSMMNPSSNLNKISGIIPISSPFSMPLRIMMGTATNSEITTSLLVLVVTTILLAVVAIRVYSSTILNTGARLSLKEAIKMAKENRE
jgi:ABC-2 type transport system permease protein